MNKILIEMREETHCTLITLEVSNKVVNMEHFSEKQMKKEQNLTQISQHSNKKNIKELT